MSISKITLAALTAVVAFSSCKKDVDPVIVIPPSTGSSITINGLVGSEPGSSAGNSAFIDLSADKQTTVERKSWDLGFYAGSEFRVILNNTTSATAKVTSKTDINSVGMADTAGYRGLAIGFDAESLSLVDDAAGDLTKTVIPVVSATEADNKVVIINRGTGGAIAPRDWYKIRVLRSGTGYTLQYAKLTATTFNTLAIAKDDNFSFIYASFDNGLVSVEPEKKKWDFRWSYTLGKTFYNVINSDIPYASSDFITINYRAGVTAKEVLTSTVSYNNFVLANVAGLTFSGAFDVIGTNWRTASPTPGASGVKTDRFYVIKDIAGNIYKLKFISFHGDEGGTRGKPVFEYKLVQ